MMLASNAVRRACNGSVAYPVQPISSPTPPTKKRMKNAGSAIKVNWGSGTGIPVSFITVYSSAMRRGIKKRMGKYQTFDLILP
ncbi:MAG: hypothetical protein AAGG66_00955 [Methanothrix soehngenii]|jgi:hypothetical protein|uniref:hypothetical protein n=1 Tax=Methanothrix soehngenii TaxID=2223 RepID=UPI003142ADA7